MLYLTLFTALTVAMFEMSTLNIQSAENLSQVERARSLAESGLRWQGYRFNRMARPKTTVGNLDQAVVDALWPSIKSAVQSDWTGLASPGVGTISSSTNWIAMNGMAIESGSTGKFAIKVEKLTTYSTDPTAADYRHYIRVTSTGTFGGAKRSASMDFMVDKRVRFAIAGKVPIQIGRNTLVEGPVAMSTAGKYPPILQLSDFRNLTSALTSSIDAFDTYLKLNHNGYDNRISINQASEWTAARAAGYVDRNADNFLDEFDLFLKAFDKNNDKAVSRTEFTNPSTSKLYDENLFKAMDALGGPLFTGDTVREGLSDDSIDSHDVYAKVNGQHVLATTAAAWTSNLASSGKSIDDMINGPVYWTDPTTPAIRFGADTSDIFDLAPTNFDTTSFKNRTGSSKGTASKVGTVFTNVHLAATDATNGTSTEQTPYGSTSFQATYKRPVFRNITFRNCRIPKGLNALFDNCTFEGATFVELTTNITKSNGTTTTNSGDGMTWSKKMRSGSFAATTALTAVNSFGFTDGNNLRFNGCTFKGPVASDVPTAYTHFSNSWEFTGATKFEIIEDEAWKKTATIVAPQTNIEMGSFTDPTAAPSTLVGVVVSGNIDIRGTSVIDGSIIVTGDGAGNTTLGWFGPSDDQTNATAMPEGGYGRLSIRYNPYRALPDGINLMIDILPAGATYSEGQ